MKKRLFSFFLVIICVCAFSLSAFAKSIDDVTADDAAQITANPYLWYAQNQMLGVEKGTGVTLVCPNGDYKTLYTGGTLVTCPYDGEALVLADAGGVKVKKIPSGIGRKDLGYASDDGTPSVSSDGGIIWQPTWGDYFDMNFYLNFTSSYYGSYGNSYNLGNMRNGAYNFTNSGKTESYTFDGTSFIVSWNYINSSYASNGVFASSSGNSGVFKVKTPVKGYYSLIKSPRMYFKAGDETFYYSADKKSTLYDIDSVLAFSQMLSVGFFKNEVTSSHHVWIFYTPKYKIIPFSASDKPTSQTNITINNNTWHGNIYTDNSTNLTYIYPEYTTINENNETVTNISNNPIIYNSETKQYYTYDTVTNNYYYITYEAPATPTPSPSPSPSPAPTETPSPSESPAPTPTLDPDENPTPTPTPGGGTIITPGGDNPGSTSTPESGNKGDVGSSGWNPLKWLTDLLKDLIESILKGIWKLLTSIFGFILWLLSLLFKLFPWMPNSGILALCAGVVVVTVIRIIKFITGR